MPRFSDLRVAVSCPHIRGGGLELELGCSTCDDRQYHLDRLTENLSDSLRPEGEGLLEPRAAILFEQTGSVSIEPHAEELGPWLSNRLNNLYDGWAIYATPGWERSQGIEIQIDLDGKAVLTETIPVDWTGDLDRDTALWRDTILSNWPRIIRSLRGPSILSTRPGCRPHPWSNKQGFANDINSGQPNRMNQRSIRDVKR